MDVLSRRTLHSGPKYDYEEVTLRAPDGRTLTRQFVRHPGAVVVVALLENARLVMIRNTRFTVGQPLLECCAGTLDHGEEPAACAARELEEETGYRPARLEPLGWFFTTPGMTDERMHAFLATGLTHVGQRLEPDERITVELMPVRDVLDLLSRGELRDGKSIAALSIAHARTLLPAGLPPGAAPR